MKEELSKYCSPNCIYISRKKYMAQWSLDNKKT